MDTMNKKLGLKKNSVTDDKNLNDYGPVVNQKGKNSISSGK